MNDVVTIPRKNELIGPDEIQVLKNSKFKDFTDAEIAYCAKVANQLNLSPFLNQIHFVKRKNKDGSYSIANQVGIDGFRLAAQRTGAYAGSDEPTFEYRKGDEKKTKPIKASIAVYKMMQGVRCAFMASARWDEYYPGDTGSNSFMWSKMPHNQLAKCAEALALRKAFPAELSSLYADDEMHQADEQVRVAPEQPQLEDGIQDMQGDSDEEYRVPGGTYAKRGFRELDGKEVLEYITRREELLVKKPDKKPWWWDDFVKRAERYYADLESQEFEPGWDG